MDERRRLFLAGMGASVTWGTLCGGLTGGQVNPGKLTVIAYNIYAGQGWPSDRPRAKMAVKSGQMAKRLALELALYEPDVINFSESPSEAITKEISEQLGMQHVRFPSGGNWPGTLLSKFEISESENTPLGIQRPKDLFTRHWGRAVLKTNEGRSLIVHSAHLHPGEDPVVRKREIAAMLSSMEQDRQSGASMLLIGDLNHGPDSEEYKMWIDFGWVDTFSKAGRGVEATFTSDQPKYRIDYVMALGPIVSNVSSSRALFEGMFRLNIADRDSFALSDHLPQMAVFDGL